MCETWIQRTYKLKYVQAESKPFLSVELENYSQKHSKHTLFSVIFFFDIYLENR